MQRLERIPLRDVLHFLGWRGTPVEPELMAKIQALCAQVIAQAQPRVVMRCFVLEEQARLAGTSFAPQGQDVRTLLLHCHEAALLAATLGAESERMLLRAQARSASEAMLLDAVLSAAIEMVCDQAEAALQQERAAMGQHVTDRFSPGYGDMPLAQSRAICDVLGTQRAIGLTVSRSGIMLPRKSVTAILGISTSPIVRRPSRCAGCAARATCALAGTRADACDDTADSIRREGI